MPSDQSVQETVRRLRPRTASLYGVGFVALAWLQSLHRYLTVEYGTAERHWDVRTVWHPTAEALLEGGSLYLGTAVDNKPPLFELLNLAVAATGKYYPVFLFLIGTANAASALLLFQLFRRRGREREGAVAALLFLASLPPLDGTVVNVRSFALVGVMAALYAEDPWDRGVAVTAGGLFSQYALLAVPVIAYDGMQARPRREARRWASQFAVAAVSVVALSFGVVAAFWGQEAAVAGVHHSFGGAIEYSTRTGPTIRSALANPLVWAGYVYDVALRILFVVILAVAGAAAVAADTRREGDWGFHQQVLALAVLFTLPLFVRALPFYWVLLLPFYAALAAVELGRWYAGPNTG
jgi:hypothetical protein